MSKKLNFNYIPLAKNLANLDLSGASAGGTVSDMTVDNVLVTDSEFGTIDGTLVSPYTGYLKLEGTNFQSPARVYISTDFIPNTEISGNIFSSTEVRLTTSITESNTYNLFLINGDGATAILLSRFSIGIRYVSTAGWFAGGLSPAMRSTVDRIIFATDTATATARGGMGGGFGFSRAGVSTDIYGWLAGGAVLGPTAKSNVDRITFATDTDTPTSRGPLSVGKYYAGGTNNDNYGWFSGGFPGPGSLSRVDRITFAADTNTASIRGPLSLARNQLAAAGNSNFSWVAGGVPDTGSSSLVNRITHANDTVVAPVRGPLSEAKILLAATSNSGYGWFAGGVGTATRSTVERITFAEDTLTASVRGPLTGTRDRLSATSDKSDYGWTGGGFLSPNTYSIVNRITFATDTSTATSRGPLSLARYLLNAVSGIS